MMVQPKYSLGGCVSKRQRDLGIKGLSEYICYTSKLTILGAGLVRRERQDNEL